MTNINEVPALHGLTVDFFSYTEVMEAIRDAIKRINASEGIDPDSPALEIRIPSNYPVPSHFDGQDKGMSPYVSRHGYEFIAVLGSFNWCVIFNNGERMLKYFSNPTVDDFQLPVTIEAEVSGQKVLSEKPDVSHINFIDPRTSDGYVMGYCPACRNMVPATGGMTCRPCGATLLRGSIVQITHIG